MQKKVREEILKAFEAELKELVRNVLEMLRREEQKAGLLGAFGDHPCPLGCRSKHPEDLHVSVKGFTGLFIHPKASLGSSKLLQRK